MKGLFKYGAVASIFLLTAGSAAFAQNIYYNPSSGSDRSQAGGWNQGSGSGWDQGGMRGMRGYGYGGTQGYGGGMQSSQGWNRSMNTGSSGPSQQDAYQELSKYGFNNVRNLQRSEGWEAHATKNGDRVHVFLDDDGMIATYRGD